MRAAPFLGSALVLCSAVAGLMAPSAGAETRPTAVLTVRVSLRNSNGQVGCTLFGSEKGYPTDPNAALQRKWCPITNGQSVCAFDPIPAGVYAVACFHDENKNGKLDTGLFGIPKEGTAASNDARGSMGPPSFNDAKFSFVGRPTELRLKMNY